MWGRRVFLETLRVGCTGHPWDDPRCARGGGEVGRSFAQWGGCAMPAVSFDAHAGRRGSGVNTPALEKAACPCPAAVADQAAAAGLAPRPMWPRPPRRRK